jgi:hypothetical protein
MRRRRKLVTLPPRLPLGTFLGERLPVRRRTSNGV